MNGENKKIPGHQRAAHIDGHGVNESYKMPSPTGKSNSSYMHPQVKPLRVTAPWQSIDRSLSEGGRPSEQLGRSKTVFAVNTAKVRGAPKPGKAGAAGVIPGPGTPTTS